MSLIEGRTIQKVVLARSYAPDREGSIDQKVWVRPARVFQKVSPDDLVDAGVDDGLEKLVRIPYKDYGGDPKG